METKGITTQEWYDFVAIAANLTPGIHVGDKLATKRLLDLLAVGPNDHILDAGSGPGITAALIAEETGARVTGIDLSPGMVSKARERAQKLGISDKVSFQVGNVMTLDFPDGTFDAVIFESLLTIMPGDPRIALAEMVRVLKPGGKIGGNEAIMDPGTLPGLESLLEQHPAIHRTYTAETLKQQFQDASLGDIVLEAVSSSQAPAMDVKNAFQEIGCGGLISFFLTSYPKLVLKLITDRRFREAHRVDEQVTGLSKEYMGYALIIGQKQGE